MQDFERAGSFYLGRTVEPDSGKIRDDLLLYDSKDLTTHAVCVGMTGSGKTGLCVGLLEEAAIDGVPAIIIDPKGDLANLMLTFPDLAPADFEPWIDPGDAARKGQSVTESARATADLWRKGLGDWGQGPERVRRLRDAVDIGLYTPGSSAGLPLRVFSSFDAPKPGELPDEDSLRDRISGTASGLLALVGIDADPVRSREHILISNLLDRAWRNGENLDLPGLIRGIQSPPFERLGVFDIDSFYPSKDRFSLAMSLNNVLASPGFQSWMQGEPLSAASLLRTPEGKPRISILSIAHLSETERMFFVTLVLNEVLSWTRAQSGTNSLRAILYMDEVFGYLPPTANPPSKKPMLTLLKQARAFGVGVVLATQNPVDLDYKALSNAGTWFLGRLQTERDKQRVLDGLESASAGSGSSFNRKQADRLLSGLKSRVFLLNNVHEDGPALFHTRWALSYLRGPMTREHIRKLTAEKKAALKAALEARAKNLIRPHSGQRDPAADSPPAGKKRRRSASGDAVAPDVAAVRGPAVASSAQSPTAVAGPNSSADAVAHPGRPVMEAETEEGFLLPTRPAPRDAALEYEARVLGVVSLHFSDSRAGIDDWQRRVLLGGFDSDSPSPWEGAEVVEEGMPELSSEPSPGARFAEIPSGASRAKTHARWAKMLKTEAYRSCVMDRWRCKELNLSSRPGQTEADFRADLAQRVHERRDVRIEKLRDKYGPKLKRLEDRILSAQERLEREEAQLKGQKMNTAISVGATVLGALFGRRISSYGSVGRATTAVRGATRTMAEREDVKRAVQKLEQCRERLADMEAEFQAELDEAKGSVDSSSVEVEHRPLKPRKSDIAVERVCLLWIPVYVLPDGAREPAR